jgi:hypothetical protein
MIQFLHFSLLLIFSFGNTYAQKILRSTINAGGGPTSVYSKTNSVQILRCIGQSGCIGTFQNKKVALRAGFLQPIIYNKENFIYAENDIDPIATNLNVKIYPNPVQQYLFVAFDDLISSEIELLISDLGGKSILVKRYPPSQLLKIDLNNLNAGNYIMQMNLLNQRIVSKFIKVN